MNRGFFSDVFFLVMVLIRPATVHDVPLLRTLIRELAEFEHELELCVLEEANLLQDGFGANPCFRALIADWDGQTAGYALFFGSYSTWAGRRLFLEDLFVREPFRGPRDWEGLTGFCRSHCDAGKLLRSAVGGARLE
jgi:hypothetical protein